jgi:hypothetical protein
MTELDIERYEEEKFDLPEIAQMLRDDLAELVPGAHVRLVRHKRRNNEIVISGVPRELTPRVYELARQYVRADWRDYWQHWGINFAPVIKELE